MSEILCYPCPEMDVTITGKSWYGRPVVRLNQNVKWRFKDVDFLTDDNKGRSWLDLCVLVRRGYETDLASVPWFLWPIISPWGPWAYAAVVHDYLCEVTGLERCVADAVMWQIMCETEDVKRWKRCAIYLGIRVGWLFWGKWRRLGQSMAGAGNQ